MSRDIIWSRMNLKEIVPELPSPLTQSIFEISNRAIFIEQYRRMGYSLPEELIKNDLTIIIGSGASVYYWYLREFLKKLVPIEDLDNVVNKLVTGSEDIITANQNLALVKLAGEAKEDGKVLEAMEEDIDSCYYKLEGTKFRNLLDEFLREFGHRGLYETDIESPRYYENPALVLGIIKNYITAGMTDPADITSRQRKIRNDSTEFILKRIEESSFSYFKKKLFLNRLENYRRFLALREKTGTTLLCS